MSDYLTALVRKFEEAEQATDTARREAERARDYYDGRQLTDDQIKALNRRKQPIVVENLIQPKVDYLCGLERQTRTDPKALPRTAAHEDDANAATDALRYVADDQNIDVKRSQVFQNMLIEGFGAVEISAKKVRGGIDPDVIHIPWERFFYDPHSSRPDFSDAEYLGYVTWMDETKALRKYPNAADVVKATVDHPSSSNTDTYDDKPRWTVWADSKRKRIRVVTIYCIMGGVWCRGVFTLAGELEPLQQSPFVDEEGQPECAIIAQSAYVDRDNDRYGIVRNLITLQDEVNKRRSKFLHLSNSRQVRIGHSVASDVENIRRELAKPDGVIVADDGDVEIISTGDMAAGHFNLLAEAKDAIKSVGPNATMQGKAGQDQSGRAILALQQGGMTEMAPLLDNLRHFNIRMFRAIWCRIRQFWTSERWVRVTDEEKNARFVGLNTTKAQMAASKISEALKAGQIDQQTAQAYAMQVQSDPTMMQPVNQVAEMDVDIQIDEVMNTPTLQIEQFDQLTKMAPMAPPQYMPVLFEMLIEASQLRNKDKLREIMDQSKQPDPMAQQQQQMALEGATAEIDKTKSETARNMAQANKAAVEAQAQATGTVFNAYQAGMAA